MSEDVHVSDALMTDIDALVKLGRAMMNAGRGSQAMAVFKTALAERPDDPELVNAARTILSHNVPTWHRLMLADTPRDQAFDRAIRRAVTPDTMVLDIGTGSGLLSMMAARAGARRVVACERHPAIAATAREIVAVNSFADRIEVFAKHSSELDRDRDLGGGADLIIAEVFGRDLLYEDALRTLSDAVTRLARPGVRLIPQLGVVRVALAHHANHRPDPHIASGFDVGKFAMHYSTSEGVPIGSKHLTLCSDPADLLSFDLRPGASAPPPRGSGDLTCTRQANGFVQWIRLELDDEESYENAPAPGASSSWYAGFHPFPDEGTAAPGERVRVHGSHDQDYLRCWSTRNASGAE